jgi:hypothetical protein
MKHFFAKAALLACAISFSASALALPSISAWENPTDKSKVWAKTSALVAKGTTVKVKLVRGSVYSCGLTFETQPARDRSNFEQGFDCSDKGEVGKELSFKTKNDGALMSRAGNYGESIASVTEIPGGAEVTWKDSDGKSTVVVRVYE